MSTSSYNVLELLGAKTVAGRHQSEHVLQEAQQCADALSAYVASAAGALPPSECEVLYGRAGLLYALLFTERTCPTVTIQQDLFQV